MYQNKDMKKIISNMYYDFMFSKKTRIQYYKSVFVLILCFITFVLGYKTRDNKIESLYSDIAVYQIKESSLKNTIDTLNTDLQKYYEMLEDGSYYRFVAFKESGILIPEKVEYDDLSMMHHLAIKYDIPHRYLYRLINKESRYNYNAISPVGAKGYMQMMPATFSGMMKKYRANNPSIIHLPHRQQNLILGTYYLSVLYKKYKRWDLALAAYNAGPGNVDKYGGVPPFNETKNYVKYILKK